MVCRLSLTPCCFFMLHQKNQPFLVLEKYGFLLPKAFFLLLISPFHAVSTVKNNSFGALNHLPLSTTALKPGGLSVFRAVRRQVIKISNLIFNSLWIKPLRHSSAVQANGGISKGIFGISKQGEVEKECCILLDRTTWRGCLVMSQQSLLTLSVNFCYQGIYRKSCLEWVTCNKTIWFILFPVFPLSQSKKPRSWSFWWSHRIHVPVVWAVWDVYLLTC